MGNQLLKDDAPNFSFGSEKYEGFTKDKSIVLKHEPPFSQSNNDHSQKTERELLQIAKKEAMGLARKK